MKHGISVICWIYNEEKRIRRTIQSFYCYDEIIVVDKSSTDRGPRIAEEMGVKVVKIPYTEEFKYVFDAAVSNATQDWLFFVTSSDIIHPELTRRLYKRIENEKFNQKYNNIKYPCVHHVLGISGKYTAIDWGYRNWLGRRDVTRGQSSVHNEIYYKNSKTYTFKADDVIAQHHLGYPSLDMAYERSLRYSKEELKKDISYKSCFKNIYMDVLTAMVKQQVWRKGWEGLASLFWMLTYHMMIFLRLFEKNMGDIEESYELLADQLSMERRTFRNKSYESVYKASIRKNGAEEKPAYSEGALKFKEGAD